MRIKPSFSKCVVIIFLFFAYPFLAGFTPRTEGIGTTPDETTYQEIEASKYFQNDHARGRLVARLYGAGAVYIGVVFVMEEISGIKVYLPLNKEKRAAIYKIANEALKQSGARAEDDENQESLMVWFKQ